MHGDFDHRRRVECLAQSHDTGVGVHLHPDDHWVLSHPDSLYLRNLHGRAPIQASRNPEPFGAGGMRATTTGAAVMVLDGGVAGWTLAGPAISR